MRALCVAMLMFGCGTPSEPARDGNADAVDANDDSDVPSCRGPDIDQDGIPLTCDPVESVVFDSAAGRVLDGSVLGDRAAGLVLTGCADLNQTSCTYVVWGAAPEATMIVTSGTFNPTEAWVNKPRLVGPIWTQDDQLLLSTRTSIDVGETLALDVATRAGTVRSNEVLLGYAADGNGTPRFVGLGTPGFAGGHVAEPRGGTTLFEIAGSTGAWYGGNEDLSSVLVDTPDIIVPSASGIQALIHGADALTPLTPPASGGTAFAIDDHTWCVGTSTTDYLHTLTPTGITSAELPVRCDAQFVRSGTSLLMFGLTHQPDGQGFFKAGVAVLRAGQGATQAFDAPGSQYVEFVTGSEIVAFVFRPLVRDLPSPILIVWPDNSSLLVSDLVKASISIEGSTIHIVGYRDVASSNGLVVVKRIHPNKSIETVTVGSATYTSDRLAVVTTREGAAVLSSDAGVYIAPSTELVFTRFLELSGVVRGGARGTVNVLVSGTNSDFESGYSRGGVFTYDEPKSGQPRLRRVTPDEVGIQTTFIAGLDGLPTQYFAYYTDVVGCRLGRLVESGSGDPQLDVVSCPGAGLGFQPRGITRRGEVVVSDPTTMYALGSDGPRVMATGTSGAVTPMSRGGKTPLVVGWTIDGKKVCLDEMPTRCWSAAENGLVVATHLREAAGGWDVSQLLYARTGTSNRFTHVRTIGPGE